MNTPNPPHRELAAFVIAVERRAVRVVKNANFQRHQSEVLQNCFGTVEPSQFIPHLMTPFYFLLRAHGTPLDNTCETLGSALVLIQRGVGLIDKVTDEELSDAWAELGPAVALNSGLTLLVLGIEQVWAADVHNPNGEALRERLMQHLLCASSGHHRELTSRHQVLPVDERIAIAADKASEFSLLIELAGICAEAAMPHLASSQLCRYRAIGREIGILTQIFNDLADLIGPGPSDDLRTGTWNIPVTMLLDELEPTARAEWERALASNETSGEAVVEALYHHGIIGSLGQRIEQGRRLVHEQVRLLPCKGPYLRLFTRWVDDLTSLLLRPPSAERSAVLTHDDTSELSEQDRTIYRQLCMGSMDPKTTVSPSSQNCEVFGDRNRAPRV